MTSFLAFIAANLGHGLDRDRMYGAQCMDLAEAYVAEVLSKPPLTGNAIDVWRHGRRPGWALVGNGPTNYPAPGSLVVWGGPDAVVGTGPYGHIAVSVLADGDHLLSLDQNWPEGSPVHLQMHSYRGVLGWLVPSP